MITVAGLRRGGLVASPALHCLLPREKRLAPLTAADTRPGVPGPAQPDLLGVLMVHRRGKRGQQLAPQGGAHRTHCQRRRGADRAGQVHGARADLRGGRRLVVQANLGGPRAGDLLTRVDQTRRPLDANQAG